MSGYPTLTLKSHVVSHSSEDNFVKPDEDAHWFGTVVNRVRQIIIDPSIYGTKTEKIERPGPIVCAAWHLSTSDQIAFGMSDGVVQVFILPSTKPIVLRHQQQRDIACLAWQPNSIKSLSVGSSSGVFVWEVISQKGSNMPSRTTLHTTRDPVTSLSYTPDGRQCLVTTTSSLLLLDCVAGDAPVWIRSVSTPGFVLMSPEYCFALLAEGQRFHILRGITEGKDSYTRLQSPVKCAVWSPTASNLFFAMSGSSLVLNLQIFNPREMYSKISSETEILIDLNKTLLHSEEESWAVEDMSMNDTGQKLAVLARDVISGISKVFTFGISLQPTAVFESEVLGDTLNPTSVSYQRNSKQGMTLCICCEDGDVKFVPEVTAPS